MDYDLKKIYDELSKIKDIKEINDYKKELDEIKNTLMNFDRQRALDTCHKLVNKYALEFDQIAISSGNNKVVTPMNDNQKSDMDLMNDLIYMANAIPVIARIKEANKLAKEILEKATS